ncbi:MAG: shikimate kinase [Clostridia bacterium]|nr:shikimate kinase [Clostridia bacterium]
MKKKSNVILIGMPTSGKTTIGTELSARIGYGYIDSDSVIVARQGKSLRDLIATLGNERYLDIEAQVNSQIAAERCVIATGGSAVYRESAVQKLRDNGTVVYLKLSFEEMSKRLGDYKARGVVLKEGFTLKDMYDERVPLYEKHADIIVELDGMSIEESVNAVAEALQCR